MSKTTTLHAHHAFLKIYLLFLHNYDVKWSNFKFTWEREYATCRSPIMHHSPLPPLKFCITFVFHFSWVLQPSQEKLKTILMQNLGGQIRCIMGDVQVANGKAIISTISVWTRARSFPFSSNLNSLLLSNRASLNSLNGCEVYISATFFVDVAVVRSWSRYCYMRCARKILIRWCSKLLSRVSNPRPPALQLSALHTDCAYPGRGAGNKTLAWTTNGMYSEITLSP